jgi:xeroderma pigmentosum group C-complementing protein
MERDSDEDEEDDEDIVFEDVDLTATLNDDTSTAQSTKDLELNLSAEKAAASPSKRGAERRRPITREERERRTHIHQTHLLCLLSHVARRNHWCNDAKVKEYLRPHLSDKTVTYLNPGTNLSQFGRTESLKNGLQQANAMWKTKFEITERGLRRALWTENPEYLRDVCIPSPWDMYECLR